MVDTMHQLHIIFIGKEGNAGTKVFQNWFAQHNEALPGQVKCKIVENSAAVEVYVTNVCRDSVSRTVDLAVVLHPSVGEEVSIRVLELVKQSKQIKLRWIHSWIVGLDHVPALMREVAASFHQTLFSNARGSFTEGLVEFTFAGLLYFHRKIPYLRDAQSRKHWSSGTSASVAGITMAILGWGDIAKAIGRTARLGFNMRVLAVRRTSTVAAPQEQPDQFADEIIAIDDLGLDTCKRRAFSEAYCVVNTLPLTPETRRFCGAEEFRLMSPTSIFINVGRGGTVDEEALIGVLRAKQILGAALDVFEEEPLPARSPLWELENVLLSPHTADLAEDYNERALQTFVSNLERIQAGATSQKELISPVSPSVGY